MLCLTCFAINNPMHAENKTLPRIEFKKNEIINYNPDYIIIANETPSDWNNKLQDYIEKPIDQNLQQVNNIQEIASEHQVTSYIASLLYHSKI